MKKIFIFLLSLVASLSYAQSGSLDTTFNPGTGANNSAETIAIQSDGKIIIGGGFTTYNGTGRNSIARLNSDGTLDTGFNPGTGANNYVWATSIQSDGKIIIGGEFTTYNGIGRNYIARLNSDGTLDTNFNPGTGANGTVYAMALQSDGKIIIGGFFSSYNGTARNRIARLNSNGTLDTNFNPGTGTNSTVSTITLQSDGKIIIGGFFSDYNGTSVNRIARLNSNGTLDTGFNPVTGANSAVRTSAIQSDGKIIIGGDFTSYDGTSINRIARLNSDGTLDTGFNPGTGTNSTVSTITLQSDGKIIIGGYFSDYDGTSINYVARLNSDGTLDTGFNSGTGPSNGLSSTAIQSDGKIIIGGSFSTYNGTGRNSIARLQNCAPSSSTLTAFACSAYTLNSQSYTTTGTYTQTLTNAVGCDSTITLNLTISNLSATATSSDVTTHGGTDGTADITVTGGTSPINYQWSNATTTEDLNGLAAGTYSVTITDANGCQFTETVTINQPPLSIALNEANWTSNLFPNPATKQTTVAVTLGTTSHIRIRLINSLGQVVQSADYSNVMNVQHSLELSELPAAMYMIEISSNGYSKTHKLLIANK